MAEILFVCGFVALVAGVAGWSWQAAAVVAGVCLMVAGWKMAGNSAPTRPSAWGPR